MDGETTTIYNFFFFFKQWQSTFPATWQPTTLLKQFFTWQQGVTFYLFRNVIPVQSDVEIARVSDLVLFAAQRLKLTSQICVESQTGRTTSKNVCPDFQWKTRARKKLFKIECEKFREMVKDWIFNPDKKFFSSPDVQI